VRRFIGVLGAFTKHDNSLVRTDLCIRLAMPIVRACHPTNGHRHTVTR
jgi:hypothetical protein